MARKPEFDARHFHFTQVELFAAKNFPPYPSNAGLALRHLHALSDMPQSEGQARARKALEAACDAYERRNERGTQPETDALSVAWQTFTLLWLDEVGEMIPAFR